MILFWMKIIFLIGIFYMQLCTICKGINSPSNVDRSELRSTSIVVTWDDVTDADSYKVKIMKTVSGTSITSCSDPSFDDAKEPFTIESSEQLSILPRTKYDIGVCTVQGSTTSSPPTTKLGVETGPFAPTDIQTSSVDPVSLNVSWVDNDVPPAGIHPVNEYKITYKITESGAEQPENTITTTPPLTSVIIHGLSANSDYIITVVSLTELALKTSDASMPTTGTTLPAKMNAPRQVTSNATSVSLTWDAASGVSPSLTYSVTYVPKPSSEPAQFQGHINGNSTTIGNLNSNTLYSFTVQATNSAGDGQISEANDIATILSQPTSLQLTGSTSTKTVSISWKGPDLGGEFETIQRYEVLCNPSSCNSNISGTNATVYGLAASTKYIITVTPVSTTGKSGEPSDSLFVTTIPGMPTFISDEQPQTTNTTTTLVWVKPEGGDAITNYSVEYRVAMPTRNDYTTARVIDHTTGISTYNYTFEKLAPGQNYDMRVVASNIQGLGTSIVESRRTIPDPVQDLQASVNAMDQEHQIDLIWIKPKGVGDDIQITYTGSHDTSKTPIKVPFHNESYSLEVQPGNIYDIVLTTFSGNINSSSKSITTNSKPSLPEDIQLSSNTSAIIVTWGALEGYADLMKIKIDGNGEVQTNPMENFFEFLNLTSNTEYAIEIYTAIMLSHGNFDESQRYRGNIKTEPISTQGDDVGLIVGLVIAAIVVVFVIAGGAYYYRRKKQKTILPPQENTNVVIPNVQVVHNSSAVDTGSKIVSLSEFTEYMATMQAHYSAQFAEEFEAMIPIGRNQSSCVGSHQDNKVKNRYKNILPYDNNRVVLDQINDDPFSDYINASYISGISRAQEYIATQGPLAKTKDDFWRLVWEQNCRNIVMVTQLVESGKVKCEKYWPSHLASDTSRDLTITTVSEEWDNDWCFRRLKITKGYNERYISHFNFTSWPDHGVPETTESLVKFVRFVRRNIDREDSGSGPIVVHCSAGVGRTGTFIAMDHLLQHLQKHSYVDIFGIVNQMRMQRMFMVQIEKQYILLHKMVQELIEHRYETNDGDKDLLYENTSNYQNTTSANPIYENAQLNQ